MMSPSDEQLREFLLGRLPAEDAARLEDAILLEDDVAERLRSEEFDLLGDYASGRLIPADREAVEQHLLKSAENRHSLRVAGLLAAEHRHRQVPSADAPLGSLSPPATEVAANDAAQHGLPRSASIERIEAAQHRRSNAASIAANAAAQHRRSRFAAVVSLLAVAVLAGVVVIPRWLAGTTGPSSRSIAGDAEDARLTGKAPTGFAPSTPSVTLPGEPAAPTHAPQLPILSLLIDIKRDAAAPHAAAPAKLHWKAGIPAVRLQLEIPNSRADGRYVVTVDDPAGRVLFTSAPASPQTIGPYRFVEVVVPTPALGPGPRNVAVHAADPGQPPPQSFVWPILGVSN